MEGQETVRAPHPSIGGGVFVWIDWHSSISMQTKHVCFLVKNYRLIKAGAIQMAAKCIWKIRTLRNNRISIQSTHSASVNHVKPTFLKLLMCYFCIFMLFIFFHLSHFQHFYKPRCRNSWSMFFFKHNYCPESFYSICITVIAKHGLIFMLLSSYSNYTWDRISFKGQVR